MSRSCTLNIFLTNIREIGYLRVKGNIFHVDGSRGRLSHKSGYGCDHLSLLPEEVDQLVLRRSPLDQQIFGVVREGQRDDLVTPELGTAEELQFAALLQVVNHHQRPLPVLGEGQQVPVGAESQR